VERRGAVHKPNERFSLTPEILDEIAADQNVELRPGDIVLIRTGWLEWFMNLSVEERKRFQGTLDSEEDPMASPGLDSKQPTAAWLWNHRIAAVAADNPAVEALPVVKEDGFLHYRLIPLLGLPLGEMWRVHELAKACAERQKYDFLMMSAVLDIPRGVGSPANAYAIL
jgi:kynurenine formamidase